MKKLLLVYQLIYVLSSASAQTTVYHPFPDSNAIWNCSYFDPGFPPCFIPHSEYFSYVLSSDTFINGNTYHQVIIPFAITSDTTGCPPIIHSYSYAGAIRNDNVAKKVFTVHPNDSTEQLLYDFNLQPGDSLSGSLTYSGCSGAVTDVDSILIGQDYRKRWKISGPAYPIYIIEGIGNVGDLFYAFCNSMWAPTAYLQCFSLNAQTLYPDSTASCHVIISTNEIADKNVSVTFSPNPFHTSTMLEMGNKEMGNRSYILKIYNTLGIPVRDEQILNINSYILHRTDLNAGLYFYELISDNGRPVAKGKFVID